jgi:hypothetical protein
MVRALAVVLVAFIVAVPGALSSPPANPAGGRGLSVMLPSGWRLSAKRVTLCDSPEQVLLAVTGRVRLHTALSVPARAALVLLMEGGGSGFPPRPARFELPELGNIGGCCEMPVGTGAELFFRDHGRRFYAFVYIGTRAPPAAKREIVRILNSLRISPWR